MRFVHSGYSPFPWDNLEKKERKENKTHGESVRDDACGTKKVHLPRKHARPR